MSDVAVVSFAQSPLVPEVETTETQMLLPVITEAVERAGIDRSDIGFTCSGSADYLTGAPFAFVSNLEATGAWPPISESHVEMDGGWALYEAWVRLQHGDVDVALVFSSGIASRADLREVLCLQHDPYSLMPLWVDYVSIAALGARAYLQAGHKEDDLADVVDRSRQDGATNPALAPPPDPSGGEAYSVAPLRDGDVGVSRDGAAAVVLAAGNKARELCDRPAWIRGIDHRADPHYPGVRDLATAPSARLAADAAGLFDRPVDVAELHAPFSHEELILRDALGLNGGATINPSGGALCANVPMVSGLIRIGEAARRIAEREADRTVGHATSGPNLQQNLVCVMEGD